MTLSIGSRPMDSCPERLRIEIQTLRLRALIRHQLRTSKVSSAAIEEIMRRDGPPALNLCTVGIHVYPERPSRDGSCAV